MLSSSILVNSSPPLLCDSEPCQAMACHLLGANPLREPTLTYCQPRLTYLSIGPLRINISKKINQSMKLFINVNSFEKSSVKLWPFCPGRDELKHVLYVSFWVNHACIFALPSACFTLVQLARSNWVSGSVPLRRGRDNAVAVQWRWPAAPWHREAAARNPAPTHSWDRLCRGPLCGVGFWIGFAWYHETPFLPTSAAGRAAAHSSVSAMVTLMTYIYLNRLSIFHIIFFESIML